MTAPLDGRVYGVDATSPCNAWAVGLIGDGPGAGTGPATSPSWSAAIEALTTRRGITDAGAGPENVAAHGHYGVMWVYMGTWIVKDGGPELGRGDQLRSVGLRADYLSLGPARTVVDGIAELVDPGDLQAPGSHRYELTGVAGHAQEVRSDLGLAGTEFVITAGDQAFLARTAGPASGIAVGCRVTAQCTLSVVADYEWDAFGLPDLRTDWYVRRLAIEHRQIDDASRSPGRGLTDRPGKVLRSFEIERMSRWDDDRIPGVRAWYLLDVTPLRD